MTTDKARELAQQIETSVTTLAAETDAARRSDVFRGWLNAMAQFHNYSWSNQLLIAMQNANGNARCRLQHMAQDEPICPERRERNRDLRALHIQSGGSQTN